MSPKILMDRDTLHALMRFCVRLTTKYENAEVFAREGGVKLLLEMKQTCGYIGFSTLANLLIRHTLEDPHTLKLAMEKVIAARTLPTIPPGYRELVFMLRRMSSAVSRDPDIFKEVAQSMLRIDVTALRRGVFSEDSRLIMKSIPSPNKRLPDKVDESTSVQVINDLLQALIVPILNEVSSITQNCLKDPRQQHHHHPPHQHSQQVNLVDVDRGGNGVDGNIGGGVGAIGPSRNDVGVVTVHDANRIGHSSGSGSGNSVNVINASSNNTDSQFQHRRPLAEEDEHQQNAVSSNISGHEIKDGKCLWNITCTKADNDKPLLPKSTILKSLAEAVRSFQSVGVIIVNYVYQPDKKTLIQKDAQTALAFILDHLLPVTEANSDRECSAAARMLIAALSSAIDSKITQYTVVSEVKSAINRALEWPEIAEKHQQLQILTGLIPTMIENCPPENPALMKIHQIQPRHNDIFYIMVRTDLISDLTKITQNLDLSSPHTVTTINAVLKPLETLLRMTNQPGPSTNSTKTKPISVYTAVIANREDRTAMDSRLAEANINCGVRNNDEEEDEDEVDDEDEVEDEDDDDNRPAEGILDAIGSSSNIATLGEGSTATAEEHNIVEPEVAELHMQTTPNSLEARVQVNY